MLDAAFEHDEPAPNSGFRTGADTQVYHGTIRETEETATAFGNATGFIQADNNMIGTMNSAGL